MTIDPLGYVIGGVCDLEHKARAERIRGAWNIWAHMKRYGYVETSKAGRFKIIKPLNKSWLWHAKKFSGQIDQQLGSYRFVVDLMPHIGKRWFVENDLGRWIDCACAASTTVCAVKTPGEGLMDHKLCIVPFQPPHADDIYQARRKRGDFGDVPAYQGTITRKENQ